MIVTQAQKAISTLPKNGCEFNVDVSAKLFTILSTKIYQYPVAACIRELATNAYDSHIAAGNMNPFIVSLPSKLSPFFVVEDFGVGLDDHDMSNIYRTVFKSTKENSNNQVGAFGVGRFAALAVSETFNIVARKNGMERHYAVSFIAGDVPRLDMLAEFPTTERNGVKVSVPVKESDFYRFTDDAKNYLSYFPIRPIVKGGGFEFLLSDETLNELNEEGIILRKRGYGKTLIVVMGGVPYHVEYNKVFDDGYQPDYLQNLRGEFIVRVDIGDVSVATSRESLEMNSHTLAAFPKIAKKIIDYAKKIYDVMWAIPHINDRIRESENLYGTNLTKSHYRFPQMLKRADRIHFSNIWSGIKLKNIQVLFNDTNRKMNSNYVRKSGVELYIDSPLSELRRERINKIFGFEATFVPYSEVFDKFKPKRNYNSVTKLDDDKKNLKVQVRHINGCWEVVDFKGDETFYYVDAKDINNVYINGKSFGLDIAADLAMKMNVNVIIRRKQDHKIFERAGIVPFHSEITKRYKKIKDHGKGGLSGWERVFVAAGLLDDVEQFKHPCDIGLALVPEYAKSVDENTSKVYTVKEMAKRLAEEYPLVPTGWNYTYRLFNDYVEYVMMKNTKKV